jgi:aarF domain-containing kinase
VSDSKKLPSGAFGRTRKLLELAANIGKEEVSHRLGNLINGSDQLRKLQHQLNQTQELVKTLTQLRGAAQKVGQLLSIQAEDILPPEIVAVLETMQDQSPPMDFASVQTILSEQLKEQKSKLEHLTPTPVAAASIGQVHRAVVEGNSVAVKVQFPGIAESIDSDLQILSGALKTLLTLSQRSIDVSSVFQELAQVLHQEADYEQEKLHLHHMRELFSKHPQYIIPKVYDSLSTQKVLTMSFEEGFKIRDWLATNPSQEDRNFYGQLILDLYGIEFFANGLVQTDPNFANFLIRPQTRSLVLLDFGAVRAYSDEFRKSYIELLKVIRSSSNETVIEKSLEMKFLNPKESLETKNAFVDMLRASVEPFDDKRQPFRFSDKDYSESVRKLTIDFTRGVRFSPPPQELLFLHRKLGGVFQLLKTLKSELDLRPYWERFVEPAKL